MAAEAVDLKNFASIALVKDILGGVQWVIADFPLVSPFGSFILGLGHFSLFILLANGMDCARSRHFRNGSLEKLEVERRTEGEDMQEIERPLKVHAGSERSGLAWNGNSSWDGTNVCPLVVSIQSNLLA